MTNNNTRYTFTRDGETVTLWYDGSNIKPYFVQIGSAGAQNFRFDGDRAEYIDWRFMWAKLSGPAPTFDGNPQGVAVAARIARSGGRDALIAELTAAGHVPDVRKTLAKGE